MDSIDVNLKKKLLKDTGCIAVRPILQQLSSIFGLCQVPFGRTCAFKKN